jgi:hypothetical protein
MWPRISRIEPTLRRRLPTQRWQRRRDRVTLMRLLRRRRTWTPRHCSRRYGVTTVQRGWGCIRSWQGLGAAMGGGNVAGAVGGTVAGDYAGAAASAAFGDTLGGNVLSNIVSGAAGAVAGGVLGGSAGAMSGANGALSADLYNRQLHPEEKTQAQKIADDAKARGITNPDGSPITVDQIENAMRYADNKQYGEFSTSGVVVPLNSNTPANAIYDTANMQLTNDSSGSYLVQDLSSVAPPSTILQSLIQQETGGANSPYTWGTYLSGSPSDVPSAAQAGVYRDANGQYRQRVTIGGDTFDIGLNGTCGTAECSAFGSNINWNDQGSKQLQQAINTGLATTISNAAAIVSFGWPTGFVGAAAGYVGLVADATNAKLQGSFAPLAPDIVSIPMQMYLHGLGMADSTASRFSTIYQQFMGGVLGGSSQGQ